MGCVLFPTNLVGYRRVSGQAMMIAILVLVFVLNRAALAENFTGRVVGISDGDTITVMHNGRGEKIRLFGIDCPENGQPFSSRAEQFISSLAFGKGKGAMR